jgi:phospholipid/cholesterol/gamma-HCH transport system ATP-binding protein
VSSIVVTHQLRDAFYIATHEATAGPDGVTFGPVSPARRDRTEFLVLRDTGVGFEGTAAELRATEDEYLRAFLS